MKLIFLDMDGVLNDFEQPWRADLDCCPEITPRCVKALNRIIRETEAKLVLSSSWRNLIINGHMSIYGFERLLQTHGVRAWLIAHTRDNGDEYRYQEIAAWLKEPWQVNKQPVAIDRYCIIDDDHDAFGGRPGVQTNGAKGLTEEDADAAIELLS